MRSIKGYEIYRLGRKSELVYFLKWINPHKDVTPNGTIAYHTSRYAKHETEIHLTAVSQNIRVLNFYSIYLKYICAISLLTLRVNESNRLQYTK